MLAMIGHLTDNVYLLMNITAEYLMPFEAGGVHKLNGVVLLNQKNIKLNKYGNLPRNKLNSLKAKDNSFIGELKGVNGVFQRKKVKKGRKDKKRLPNGTRRDRQNQPAPRLLIRFGDALPVQPVVGYQERALRMAKVLLPQEISRALEEAMCSAK